MAPAVAAASSASTDSPAATVSTVSHATAVICSTVTSMLASLCFTAWNCPIGRPIGQFQAVKHRLANMLVTVEQITAVAWDTVLTVAAGESVEAELAAATAGAIVFDGYADNAKDCVQLLGGIGFTWEHDVHLHLKRAVAARQLFGESDVFRHEVAGLARGGPRRSLATALPDGAEQVRAELTPIIEELKSLDGDDRRRRMVDAGLVCP